MSTHRGTSRLRDTPIDPTRHSKLSAVAGVRGELVVTNDDIAGPIDSSDEWIQQRTGIVTRRRAASGTDVIDLAEAAAASALQQAGLTGADLGAVIVSTITHFSFTPSAAAILADRLGATPAPAWDISAACAGYCYGIAQADALVRAGTADHVLVIGAEKMSEIIDPTDRSISFLLGDGAGAAIVSASAEAGIGPTAWGSDGSRAPLIGQTASLLAMRDDGAPWPTLRQEGPSVFKWAGWQLGPTCLAAIEAAGLTPADIEVFIPHQANMRIIDKMAAQIGLSDDVVIARDIADTGNTSAASIPLATERLLREGAAPSGAIALQIGFGAGLVYAAQVVALP